MLIRSQDKESVVNFDNVYALYLAVKRERCVVKEQYETEIMCSNGSQNTEGKLGVYSSKEKAKKVLDMICDHNFWYQGTFQMPQDDEVTI